MYPNYIGMINNASFSMMNNSEAMMGLMRGTSSRDINSIHQAEKGLQMDRLNNQTEYSAYSLMEDSARKLRNDNIKRTFSTFA